MAPRSRKQGNADLPKNLYTTTDNGKEYYVFEHPITHKRAGLGSDRSVAIEKATLLNAALAEAGITKQRTKPKGGQRMSDLIAAWRPIALDHLNATSRKNADNWISMIEREIGKESPNSITTADLFRMTGNLKPSSQKRIKSFLVRLFDYAISTGMRITAVNPAEALHVDKQIPVQRKRLTLEQFKAVYAKSEPWMQSAMMLMVQTTLRPSDVLRLRFDQVEGSRLHAEVSKTSKHLAIKLNKQAMDAVARQRQSGLVCPYIIHRKPGKVKHRKGCDHLFQVTTEYWSSVFTEIRDQLGIYADLPAKQRPSLYEIRALAAYLYEQQGSERCDVKALMAHTSEEMTARYQSRHGVTYAEVESGLIL